MPKLLDLFCGAGGAAMGYHRAGFDVVGVDLNPQPHYPFPFIQADALEPPVKLDEFDVIHASPPCQRYSVGTRDPSRHPDLIDPTRALLADHRYVIENVPGAPIDGHVFLCGSMFGLGVSGLSLRRHRYFELWDGAPLIPPPTMCDHSRRSITVTGHGTSSGNRATLGRSTTIAEWREAMDIDWTNRKGLTEAIPPAYTEWIGSFL